MSAFDDEQTAAYIIRDPRCLFAWAIREAAGDLALAANKVRTPPEHLRETKWKPEDFAPLAAEWQAAADILAAARPIVDGVRIKLEELQRTAIDPREAQQQAKALWAAGKRSESARMKQRAAQARVDVEKRAVLAAVVKAFASADYHHTGLMIADGHVFGVNSLQRTMSAAGLRSWALIPGAVGGGLWCSEYPRHRFPRTSTAHVVVAVDGDHFTVTGPGADVLVAPATIADVLGATIPELFKTPEGLAGRLVMR